MLVGIKKKVTPVKQPPPFLLPRFQLDVFPFL